jgi:hypothetical protein
MKQNTDFSWSEVTRPCWARNEAAKPCYQVHSAYKLATEKLKLNSVAVVRKRTISNTLPPLDGDVSANLRG